MCVLSAAGCKIIDPETATFSLRARNRLDYADNDKGEFDHFMLKGLQQPEAPRNAARPLGQDGHVSLDRVLGDTERICRTDRLIPPHGTSYHAASWAVPDRGVDADPRRGRICERIRYRNSPTHENPTVLAITQFKERRTR